MRLLNLYDEAPVVPVAQAPRSLNSECEACPRHKQATNVCIGAEGQPGGLLVVFSSPSKTDDRAGRVAMARAGQHIKRLVARAWDGPIVFDHAVRCHTSNPPTSRQVGKCAPFSAGVLAFAKPTRIITIGRAAAEAYTGHAPMMMHSYGAYSYRRDAPIFMLPELSRILGNRLRRAQFETFLKSALTDVPRKPPLDALVYVVDNEDDAWEAVYELEDAPSITVDVETFGAMYNDDFRLLSVSITAGGQDDSWVWSPAALADPGARKALADFLTSGVPLIGQNWKFDAKGLALGLGIPILQASADTMLWRKLLQSDVSAKLSVMTDLVGMGGAKKIVDPYIRKARKVIREQAIATETPTRGHVDAYAYAHVPEEVLLRYNARDTVATGLLADTMRGRIETEDDGAFGMVWKDIVAPAQRAVAQMEAWGLKVNRRQLSVVDQFFQANVSRAKAKLDQYPAFNANAPREVGNFLYKVLGLAPPFLTATGQPSTDKHALKILANRHPAVRALQDFRRADKLYSTYVASVYKHIRDDGRIHPSFRIEGTETGRMSCSEPNLQNIPRADREDGKLIRQMYVAEEGNVLLEADYSQIELRVAAMLSGDLAMQSIYHSGEDYHLRTAKIISRQAWGIAPEHVIGIHRTESKAVTFGLLYGKSDAGLAGDLGCSVKQAGIIREAILGNFPGLKRWIAQKLRFAQQNGHTRTSWQGRDARRRWLYNVANPDNKAKGTAERSSWNTPIQGTASDYCLVALTQVVDWIRVAKVPAKVVVQVHDSIMLEVPEHLLEEIACHLRDTMVSIPSHGVPLVADMKSGCSWGDMTDLII